MDLRDTLIRLFFKVVSLSGTNEVTTLCMGKSGTKTTTKHNKTGDEIGSMRSYKACVLMIAEFAFDTCDKRAFAVFGRLAWNCKAKGD